MAAPYLPPKDADFDIWTANFNTLLTATPANYGLVAGDALIVDGVVDAFHAAYLLAVNPATRTPATIATKDATRATAEATIRPYAMRIRNNASVSNALKIGIGLVIPSFPPSPIPAPVDAPELSLVRAISLEATLGYKTVGSVGKAKPFGSIGIELRRSIGVAFAVDPVQCLYAGIYTKSPLRQPYDAGDQGKKATYFARFTTRSGPGGVAQTGPWSDALNLIVM